MFLNTRLINDVNEISNSEVVERIIKLNEGLCDFWVSAQGWAPIEAAELLSRSRLDWQVSLTYYLRNWIMCKYKDSDYASLILAWVNLGSIVEGTVRLALSVFYNDYMTDEGKVIIKGKIQDPDELRFDRLRSFCNGKLWEKSSNWDTWILHIQQRRNAIHAYKDRELGSFDEFYQDLRMYLMFLRHINGRLPYPDTIFEPREV
ncbi:hypothetical protein JCM14036_12560 [Desulfotomaculum defluvii]